MIKQDWKPRHAKPWKEFMERGFDQFYFQSQKTSFDFNTFLSGLSVLVFIAAACVTAAFAYTG